MQRGVVVNHLRSVRSCLSSSYVGIRRTVATGSHLWAEILNPRPASSRQHMLQIIAELIDRRTSGPAQELTLRAPELARALAPGQAVLAKCGWGLDPYLRRTFHPVAIDAETWTLRVPPGGDWGHAWLRAAPLGTAVDCLGPVGIGYLVPLGVRNVLCVGVGEPAWALMPVVAQAEARGLSVALAMEARTPRELIPTSRLPAAVEYHAITADGRRIEGQWSELLTGTVSSAGPGLLGWADVVVAAAPLAFYGQLAAAVKAVRYEISRGFAQVLYPVTFLCGSGACQACVAEIAGGRRRVCQRGPVFDLMDVVT
jgi:dihydroorotate dehydrogenase electron transfer subunit